MSDLLIHSMSEFAGILLPALEIAGARHVVEVGAEHGTMTRLLLDHVETQEGTLTSIDTDPPPHAEALFQGRPCGRLVRSPSLDVLPALAADAYLVDGDHNYFTVLHESRHIWEQSRRHGRPFLVFYHDVGWPCARRDLYYAPERIPERFRHPHSWDHGVTLDEPGVVPGGFRGEGRWAAALREGGPGNGVLTAIEDFVLGKEEHLLWAMIPAVFGLGILFESRAPWTEAMRAHLLPYHENPLLARLERNRLECYLRVIEWQDEEERRRAA